MFVESLSVTFFEFHRLVQKSVLINRGVPFIITQQHSIQHEIRSFSDKITSQIIAQTDRETCTKRISQPKNTSKHRSKTRTGIKRRLTIAFILPHEKRKEIFTWPYLVCDCAINPAWKWGTYKDSSKLFIEGRGVGGWGLYFTLYIKSTIFTAPLATLSAFKPKKHYVIGKMDPSSNLINFQIK